MLKLFLTCLVTGIAGSFLGSYSVDRYRMKKFKQMNPPTPPGQGFYWEVLMDAAEKCNKDNES